MRVKSGSTSTLPTLSRSRQPPICTATLPGFSRVTNSRPRGDTLATSTRKTLSVRVGPDVVLIDEPRTVTRYSRMPLAVVETGNRKLPLVADGAIVVEARSWNTPPATSRLSVTVTPWNGVTVPVTAARRPASTTEVVSLLVSTGSTGAGTNGCGITSLDSVKKGPSPAELVAKTLKA